LVIIDILHPRCKSILWHVVPSTTFFDAFLLLFFIACYINFETKIGFWRNTRVVQKSVAKQESNGLVG
jgi:hypothetical protein